MCPYDFAGFGAFACGFVFHVVVAEVEPIFAGLAIKAHAIDDSEEAPGFEFFASVFDAAFFVFGFKVMEGVA
jgi:hypothetical protein